MYQGHSRVFGNVGKNLEAVANSENIICDEYLELQSMADFLDRLNIVLLMLHWPLRSISTGRLPLGVLNENRVAFSGISLTLVYSFTNMLKSLWTSGFLENTCPHKQFLEYFMSRIKLEAEYYFLKHIFNHLSVIGVYT